MVKHKCEAVIVSCIDFRFQQYIDKWLAENFQPATFDRVAFAGGIKDLDTILNQVKIAYRLHRINKAILINHEDCGAYGETGTVIKHAQDLRNAALKVNQQFPGVNANAYYLHLDGTFEKV